MARSFSSHNVVVVLLTVLTAISQASIASNWTNPNAHLPSFSSTYRVGERIYLSWQPLNGSWNDLWLIRPGASDQDSALRIATTIDISDANSFPWTVAVSQEEVLQDTRFAFVFLPQGSEYNSSAQSDLQSPSFNLMLVNQATPPNGTVLATTNAVSLTSSASPTSTIEAQATSTFADASTASQHGRDLDITQIVGIAVGVFATVALVISLGGYLVLKRKQSTKDPKALITSELPMTGPYEILGDSKRPSEASSKEIRVYEMKCSDESLAHESDSNPVHEVGNTVKRPGLHEMPGNRSLRLLRITESHSAMETIDGAPDAPSRTSFPLVESASTYSTGTIAKRKLAGESESLATNVK